MATWRAKKRAVLKSVFYVETAALQPPAPGASLLSLTDSQLTAPFSIAHDEPALDSQHRWDQAWDYVTGTVRPRPCLETDDILAQLPPRTDPDGPEWREALDMLWHPDHYRSLDVQHPDILQWYTRQVRRHFVRHVVPLLVSCEANAPPEQALLQILEVLDIARRQYARGVDLFIRGLGRNAQAAALDKFGRDTRAMVCNTVSDSMMDYFADSMAAKVDRVLGLDGGAPAWGPQDQADLVNIVHKLWSAGLAGGRFQTMLANTMSHALDKFVHASYGRGNSTTPTTTPTATPIAASPTAHSTNIAQLRNWVKHPYAQLMIVLLDWACGTDSLRADVARWQDLAVARLAAVRIRELFDIVLGWPDSRPDLQDLRESVTTPRNRLELTDTFSAILHKRLLHPGRSTLEILKVYISMIRTFHALDPSKVLLDRVVRSLQLYLCQRDDAIRIVVTGLLADPKAVHNDNKNLVDLAAILNDPAQQRRPVPTDDDDVDWNDLDWEPDPIDAGVNYKRPRSEDVIGTLIGALGARDVFIKEFQVVMAERLLSSRSEFSQDMRVLALLKRRYGEHSLQNCNVMLRDIRESHSLDELICSWVSADNSTPRVEYHAKILSRLFWPTQDREYIQVPPPVLVAQKAYALGFERAKAGRKLAWFDNLGTATVRLEFVDRTVECECRTHEAAVIYAFGDEAEGNSSSPVRKTVDDIEDALMMDHDLITGALRFWVRKGVLSHSADVYSVIESAHDEAHSNTQSTSPTTESPKKSTTTRSAQETERRQIYWQFMVGMLTNSAPAMPLPAMATMLGMLIPGGFKWSHEELRDFLDEKVGAGELEFGGGKYRLRKK